MGQYFLCISDHKSSKLAMFSGTSKRLQLSIITIMNNKDIATQSSQSYNQLIQIFLKAYVNLVIEQYEKPIQQSTDTDIV